MRSKKHTSLALLAATLFVLAVLLSALVVVLAADHDCSGDHCLVCSAIHHVEQTLKHLRIGATLFVGVMPAVAVVLLLLIGAGSRASAISLVSQKVRLDI